MDKEPIDKLLEENNTKTDDKTIRNNSKKNSRKKPDDLFSILVNVLYNFDWIIIVVVALAYILVMSDFYYDTVLSNTGGLNDDNELTDRGYAVQLSGLLGGTVLGRMLFSLGGW